jgi:hypothetical protein
MVDSAAPSCPRRSADNVTGINTAGTSGPRYVNGTQLMVQNGPSRLMRSALSSLTHPGTIRLAGKLCIAARMRPQPRSHTDGKLLPLEMQHAFSSHSRRVCEAH